MIGIILVTTMILRAKTSDTWNLLGIESRGHVTLCTSQGHGCCLLGLGGNRKCFLPGNPGMQCRHPVSGLPLLYYLPPAHWFVSNS